MSPELQARLLSAAERALTYFDNQLNGRGYLNGMYDDITIGRHLTSVIIDIRHEQALMDERNEQHRREAEQELVKR